MVRDRSLDAWTLPGGFQDLDESIEETAVREIREELRLETEPEALVSVYSGPQWITRLANGDAVQNVQFFFRMKLKGDVEGMRIQESELSEARFFDLEKLPEDREPFCRKNLEDLKGFDGRTVLR